MKLESLNSPKYSLSPEKMGQLVGGEKITVRSPGGTYKISGSGREISCDYDIVTYANEADKRHNICTNVQFYGTGSKPE